MRAVVVRVHNPFAPRDCREISVVTRRQRLGTWMRRQRIRIDRPTICTVNGQPKWRREWASQMIEDGDVIAFVTLPQGGGEGGSNTMQIVLLMAVVVGAPYLAAMVAPSLGLATSGFAFGMLKAGIMLGGSMLVNEFFPPQKPLAGPDIAAPSPTYSLDAQGNYARLGYPIASWYGRHVIYPDLAAAPYGEYDGDDQYLHLLLCIGQGHYEIEAIRIDETPIASFPEVSYEIIGPGGQVTMFPTNVSTSVEVAGQDLPTGAWVGPFIAVPSGAIANTVAVDIVAPRGLFYAADNGSLQGMTVDLTIEAQAINDAGVAVGPWIQVAREANLQSQAPVTGTIPPTGIVKLSGPVVKFFATSSPLRWTFKYRMPQAARWQFRVRRNDTVQSGMRYGHQVVWAGLRAYMPGSQTYGGVTIIAVRMRATAGLSGQASRRVNVIATRMLPVWSPGVGWSPPQATRSIAWAIADICRAHYGARRVDSQYDLAYLAAVDQTLQERGDFFDGGFDKRVPWWDAIRTVARCGRMMPYTQGGVVRFVRDVPQSIPVALFSMRNIVRGSFKVEYILPSDDTADAVEVEYEDPDS